MNAQIVLSTGERQGRAPLEIDRVECFDEPAHFRTGLWERQSRCARVAYFGELRSPRASALECVTGPYPRSLGSPT